MANKKTKSFWSADIILPGLALVTSLWLLGLVSWDNFHKDSSKMCITVTSDTYFPSRRCEGDKPWTYQQRHGLEMEKRKLHLEAEQSQFLERKASAEHEIVLAKLESERRLIRARASAELNKLIEGSVTDKIRLKDWRPETSDVGTWGPGFIQDGVQCSGSCTYFYRGSAVTLTGK